MAASQIAIDTGHISGKIFPASGWDIKRRKMESTSLQKDITIKINQAENWTIKTENAAKFEDELNTILLKGTEKAAIEMLKTIKESYGKYHLFFNLWRNILKSF